MKKNLILSLFFLTILASTKVTYAVYEPNITQNLPKYVPNEVIVKYKPGFDPKSLKTQSSNFSTTSIDRAGALQDYSRIKQFNTSLGITNTDTAITISKDSVVYTTNGSKTVDQIVSAYGGDQSIEYIQPNYLYYILKTTNDPLYGQMWGLAKINMPGAWDKTTGSNSVKAVDIDTGIDSSHPDLAANVVEEKGFSFDRNGRPVPCALGDSEGHGTHTAGTIGAVGNNSKGVTGVNWTVGIMALKVFCPGAPTTAITAAINYAASHGAKVINMSLGGDSRDPQMADAIQSAVNSGVTVVVSAGNCGTRPSRRGCGNPPRPISSDQLYPSSDPNVITVGATNNSDQLAVFSSTGSSVDVVAPGVAIASTIPGGRYGNMDGTSMSSPHVAGLVALMYALNPSIRPSEVKSILESTAVDLGTPGRDRDYGAGRIDAAAALARVSGGGGGGGPTPTVGSTQPTPTPSSGGTTPPPAQVTPGGPTIHPGICDPSKPSLVNKCLTPNPTPPGGGGGGGGGCDNGDYDCNGTVDQNDFTKWQTDYLAGNASLGRYEEWRRVMFKSR